MDSTGIASAVAAVFSAITAGLALWLALIVYRRDRKTRTLDALEDFAQRVIPLCTAAAKKLVNEMPDSPSRFTREEAKQLAPSLPADFFARDDTSRLERETALNSLETFAMQVSTRAINQKLAREACGEVFCDLVRLFYGVISTARSDEMPQTKRPWERTVELYIKWSRPE